MKNRDSHLVELVILRHLVFVFAFVFENASYTDPRSLANFGPQVGCSDVTKTAISEKNRRILKKYQMMSNCCMRGPAKFRVDNAVRFLAIANIRKGGGG